MDIADILLANASDIPPREYPDQPLAEIVDLLPASEADAGCDIDLATYLGLKEGLALCQDYFVSGNLAESARKLRVRYPVALRTSKENWFLEELASLEHQSKIRQKADLDRKLSKVLGRLDERLEYGDEVVTKDGIVHVAVKARDLAAIAAILTERREKLDEATRPALTATRHKVESLADHLRDKAKAGAANAVVVEMPKVGNGS